MRLVLLIVMLNVWSLSAWPRTPELYSSSDRTGFGGSVPGDPWANGPDLSVQKLTNMSCAGPYCGHYSLGKFLDRTTSGVTSPSGQEQDVEE